MVFRPWEKARTKFQALLYKLGPTKCILLGSLFLFGSFIVQLLTSIGVPYIKSFDFYRFDLENYTFVELGMWAACSGRQALTFPTRPDLNEPEQFSCPPASWGWKTLRFSGITDNFFDRTLPKALIMHPISCCFTFFAMTAALVTIRRKKSYIALPIFSFLSCLFALVSFFIDVATFAPAGHKLKSPRGTEILGLTVVSYSYGPAFWLSLTCFVLDIVGNGIIIFGYSIWRYQRISRAQRRSGAYSDDMESKGMPMTRRGYLAQSSATSLHDQETLDSKGTLGRRNASSDEEQEELETMQSVKGEETPKRLSTDNRSARPSTAGRRSEDGTSVAPSRYEDPEEDFVMNDSEDEDGRSARSVYEDASVTLAPMAPAPAPTKSKGFIRRKPVQNY